MVEKKKLDEEHTASDNISANLNPDKNSLQGDSPHSTARTKCKFCLSPLSEPGASKCINCSEYQTLPLQIISRIGFSDLALLVSVSVLAWVAVHDFIRGEKAALDLKVVECATSRISIAVFNSGSQPGILSRLELVTVDADAEKLSATDPRFPLNLDMNDKETGALFVTPGNPVLQNLQVTSSMKNKFKGDCALWVLAHKYEESKQEEKQISEPACKCKDVR